MYKSGLERTTKEFKTDFWNDSCSTDEINYALEYGAVGATTNPVIVKNVVEQEFDKYKLIIQEFIRNHPNETEDQIAWRLIEYTAVEGAKLLEDIYNNSNGQKGRISIQTDTKFHSSSEKLTEQAIRFHTLAPNIQVKMPVTEAGVKAFEEVTYHGVSINATVSYSVAQALAVAEAVERGLKRRESEGKSTETMHPVCTIMVGRVDDWLKESLNGNDINPEALEFGGVAVIKKAYHLFKERGYRTTLLAAAYRNEHQWLELVGGNLELTIPHKWIKKFNESNYEISRKIDNNVDQNYLDELSKHPEFKKMYDEDGMTESDFFYLGATQNTLNQFLEGYDDLVKIVRKEQLQFRK